MEKNVEGNWLFAIDSCEMRNADVAVRICGQAVYAETVHGSSSEKREMKALLICFLAAMTRSSASSPVQAKSVVSTTCFKSRSCSRLMCLDLMLYHLTNVKLLCFSKSAGNSNVVTSVEHQHSVRRRMRLFHLGFQRFERRGMESCTRAQDV